MSGQSQLSLLPEFEPPKTWETDDDYETPEPEARMLASTVVESDSLIIDAGAGCGNITRHLVGADRRVFAVEANPKRFVIGAQKVPGAAWIQQNFLETSRIDINGSAADLVIGNPPFSLLVEFINHSFDSLLGPAGRIAFLLPGDTFHKPTVHKAINTPFSLGERKVIGRIAYLKDGRPVRGRQVYDSIFILNRAPNSDRTQGGAVQFLPRSDYK